MNTLCESTTYQKIGDLFCFYISGPSQNVCTVKEFKVGFIMMIFKTEFHGQLIFLTGKYHETSYSIEFVLKDIKKFQSIFYIYCWFCDQNFTVRWLSQQKKIQKSSHWIEFYFIKASKDFTRRSFLLFRSEFWQECFKELSGHLLLPTSWYL